MKDAKNSTVTLDSATWDDICKVITWVHNNPGCHPANIKNELERLYKTHIEGEQR